MTHDETAFFIVEFSIASNLYDLPEKSNLTTGRRERGRDGQSMRKNNMQKWTPYR